MKFLSANKFIIAALALCLSACVFVFIISVNQTKKVKSTSAEVIHTNKTLGALDALITTTLDLQNCTRGFVITGDEDLLSPYKNAAAQYTEALKKIKQQEGRTRIYTQQLDSLELYIGKRLAISERIITLRRQQKTQEAAALVASGEGSLYAGKIRDMCDAIKLNELLRQDETRTTNEKAILYLNTILYAALVSVALLGIVLFIKVKTSFNQHRTGESKFRALLESAPDAMLISDEKGLIQLVNKRAIDMLGYSREEMTGMPVEELIPHNMRDKHRFLREGYAMAPKVRDIHSGIEMQAMDKAGKIIPVEISLSPIHTNGQTFVAAALRDISQRKNAQEEIQTLFTQINQASEAIYVVDHDLIIKSWNKGAENLYGFTKAEAIGQNSLYLLKTELTGDDMQAALDEIEKNGFWSGEVKRFTKKGGEIFVYSSLSEIKDDEGQPKSYVSVSFDITQRKKLEDQVKHLANIVENSSEAILSRGMDRRIISWNKGAEKMFGYTKEEALGKSVTELGIMRITEGMKVNLEKEVIQTGEWQEETDYYHKNGNAITGAVTANTVKDSKGNVTALSFVIKDISARKLLERHLRTYNDELEQKIKERTQQIAVSENKYRLLYNNNPLPMFVLDLETLRFLDMNDSAERLYGYSRKEFQAMSATDIRPEEDKNAFINLDHSFDSTLNSENRGIWRHIKKDGTVISVEIFAQSIYFDGRKARLILVNDVTEKLKAERKLKKSESRFRALVENSYDIITMLDKDFNVLYRTPSAQRVTGRKNEDVLGIDGRKKIHPDDLPMVAAGIKKLLAAPGNVETATFRYQHNDGSWLWFEGNATNLLHDENVRAIIFNYRDVTESVIALEKLKASEERYRSALDNMIEGVQIIGFDWKYKYVNDAVIKQAHLNKEELLGFTMMEKYPGIENTSLFSAMQECFTSRVPAVLENKFVYPNNAVAWFELSIQPVQEGIFILSVDITDKVEAAAALKEEKDKLSAIAATSPGLIYSFHMTSEGIFSFPFLSNVAEDIFGYAAELLKENVRTVIESALSEDREKLEASILASASTMQPWQLEFRYMHPAKGLRWLEGNSLPVKAEDGNILWHGIIMDITERKIAEERITEKNAQLETLSNNLPGVMIFQLSGENYTNRRFTYVSKEVTRLTGKTPEEVLANPSMLYEMILEDDTPRLIASEVESYQNLTTFNEEVRCRSVNGEIRWLNIISTPRKTNEGKIVWDGFHVDITDRKKNEAALRSSYMEKRMLAEKLTTILNTLPANIALLDEDGVIVDVNHSWMEFAAANGWYGSSYGIGANYISFTEGSNTFDYDDTDRQEVAAGIKAVLSKKTDKFLYEYSCHTLNKKQWFRKIISPLSGDGYNGALVMHIDVTQIHKLEEERIKSKTEEQKMITNAILQGQEKERNAIGKELHDNINQILAGINMLLGLILKRPERTNELLPLCIENVNKAITENRKIAHELVSPNEYSEDLVEQVKNVAKNMLQNAGIAVRIDHKHFDETLVSKEQQLAAYRIIQEQCNNILKYAHAKKVVILLHTSPERFLLIIKDNGAGMKPGKHAGGIGLQNIKSRITVFNGMVNISSKPGDGFMLSVEIPLAKQAV